MHGLNAVRYHYDGHGVERVCRVGRAVGVDGVVGIAVVSDHDNLVAVGLGCLDNGRDTLVYCENCLLDGLIYARVANHVAIGEIEANEVELLRAESLHQLVLDLIGAHLGLQVVGCNLG